MLEPLQLVLILKDRQVQSAHWVGVAALLVSKWPSPSIPLYLPHSLISLCSSICFWSWSIWPYFSVIDLNLLCYYVPLHFDLNITFLLFWNPSECFFSTKLLLFGGNSWKMNEVSMSSFKNGTPLNQLRLQQRQATRITVACNTRILVCCFKFSSSL